VLTTNLPFKQWSTVFPGAACVSALIDRFVQHCHILDIDADSWRQKESLAMSEARPKPRPETAEPSAPAAAKKR
jgi:hypothetical protein